MKMITRKLALETFAIYKILNLSEDDIEDYIFAGYFDQETGDPIAYNSIYDENIQNFLVKLHTDTILHGVSNDYLQHFLKKHFDIESNIIVFGKEPNLYKCPCCEYLTLPTQGQYDVCPVCLWEDDGKSEDSLYLYSYANESSLNDYKSDKLPKLLKNDIYYKKG